MSCLLVLLVQTIESAQAGGNNSASLTLGEVLLALSVPLVGVITLLYEWYDTRRNGRSSEVDRPIRRPDNATGKRIIKPVMPRGAACGIFISYRRQDEPNFAGRLYDRLAVRFGKNNVFMDVDSIELGLDFADVINRSLSQCKVLIVVIGKNWLRVADGQGRPRLENPNDYVRIEIETALRRGIRVIPVLVEGASVPRSPELPDSMESLSRRNGIEMSHLRFSVETDQLIKTLERVLKTN